MDVEGLQKLVLWKKSGYVVRMARTGECVNVSTDRGIWGRGIVWRRGWGDDDLSG